MAQVSQIETDDGISWHVEQSGSGPPLILIPSGEGDCSSFAKLVALLSPTFTITTFDMPGFSRTTAPPAAMEHLCPPVIAKQIIRLMDKLSIPSAIMFGCSSGGLIARALLIHYPDRVERIMIHEVPLSIPPEMAAIAQNPHDAQIVGICKHIFGDIMNEDKAAWEALGPEYHARLENNYVTWIRKYVDNNLFVEWNKEQVMSKPVSWTLGGLSTMGTWFDNVVMACESGIKIGLLPCRNFPQVSIPEKLAEYIRSFH